jgi:Cof subfamily protein (haloacid dehalogenase superfamily)
MASNNNKIKAVFFDIDGTLVSHKQGKVPDSTRQALNALRENGIMIILASGRHKIDLDELPINDIEFDGYLALNGQLLLDSNREMYAGLPIDEEEMKILAGIFKARKIPFAFMTENRRYINYVDDTVISTLESTMGTIPDLGTFSGEKIYQIWAFVPEKKQQMLKDLLDECHITSWNDTAIDIIPKGGGKSAGMQIFLDEHGLKRSETMAFGDGENDIDMLKFAGIGVAMGNAKDSVKAVADYVTDSVDEHGIENALRHFGLIR